MKLSEAFIGQIIVDPTDDTNVGYIMGLTQNSTKETIFEIKWNTGEVSSIHPANTMSLKEYELRSESFKSAINKNPPSILKDATWR